MTSKALSNQSPADNRNALVNVKLLLNNIRQNKALIIITGILLFCARPLVQIIALMNYHSAGGGMSRGVPLHEFAENNARNSAMLVTGAALALAVFIGLNAASHMHSRKAAIFYGSVPIRRLNLFATQYISGLAYFIPAFMLSYVLSLVLMPFGGAILINTQFYLGALCFFLLIYSFIILCANIAGTVLNALFTAVYFCAILPALFLSLFSFVDMFYRFTSVFSMISVSFWEFIMHPVIIYFPRVFEASRRLSVADCIMMLVFAAALTCLAYLFNSRAKTENAEKPFYFVKFLSVLKYSTLAVLVITAGMLFYTASGESFPFLIAGIFIGGILAFLLLNLVIYKNIRETFRGIKRFLIFAVCVSLCAGIAALDLFGVDRHIPDASRVSFVSYGEWNQRMFYNLSFEHTAGIRSIMSMGRFNDIIIRDPEAIQLVNNIFEAALQSESRRRARSGYSSQAFAFREYLPIIHNSFGVIYYRLANGGVWAKTLHYFDMVFSSQEDAQAFHNALAALRDSAGYRQAVYYPLTNAETMRAHLDAAARISVELRRGDDLVILAGELSRAEAETLINALSMDIETLDMREFQGQYDMMLTFRREDNRVGGIQIRMNEGCFERTIDFLFDNVAPVERYAPVDFDY